MKIGVLALQGNFSEHIACLRRLGVETAEVRLPVQLEGCSALIIPGGESTAIGKLAVTYNLIGPLREFGDSRPMWGTCAGAILLSRDAQRDQPLLGLMDITVERNAFGRQVDSFVTDLEVPILEQPDVPFPGIFIRAPLIDSTGKGVEVIARVLNRSGRANKIVAARQDRLLATSFHPELTDDLRFHKLFLGMVDG
jgi:5'-phosphate synthase pdxT subunit